MLFIVCYYFQEGCVSVFLVFSFISAFSVLLLLVGLLLLQVLVSVNRSVEHGCWLALCRKTGRDTWGTCCLLPVV